MSWGAAKDIYKQRAATAECTNAQARNRGPREFRVRGLDKDKSVAFVHGLTHNMVCSWRLIPIAGRQRVGDKDRHRQLVASCRRDNNAFARAVPHRSLAVRQTRKPIQTTPIPPYRPIAFQMRSR